MMQSNRTLKCLDEYFRIEDYPLHHESILNEYHLKGSVPNYNEIYGVSYKMIEHILMRYEEKAKL